VLVFGVGARHLLPFDVHPHRIADRLGLVAHDGKLNVGNRDLLVAGLIALCPDLVPAHFAFLLLGRSTCTASAPDCPGCFMNDVCPYPNRETE
jgi:endonuclease III